MKTLRQHDVEPSKARKLSMHSSRSENPSCSHISKDKRVSEAAVSSIAVRGTSLMEHGKWVVNALGSVDLAIAMGLVSLCRLSLA